MKNSLVKGIAFVVGLFMLVSCDKDFNSLGSDLIDGNHFVLERYEVQNLKMLLQSQFILKLCNNY